MLADDAGDFPKERSVVNFSPWRAREVSGRSASEGLRLLLWLPSPLLFINARGVGNVMGLSTFKGKTEFRLLEQGWGHGPSRELELGRGWRW